jgi:hypothetical protein
VIVIRSISAHPEIPTEVALVTYTAASPPIIVVMDPRILVAFAPAETTAPD